MGNISLLLYIDPGTGAMLFTTLIGLFSVAAFAVKKLYIKLKFVLSGGKMDIKIDDEKKSIVIFSDHKRYWNVFKPICDELERRKVKSFFWTASHDDPALNEKYEYVECLFIGEGNKAYAYLNMMNAHICLATTPGLDVYQWKRSKNTDFYVHTFHAISWITMYRMFGMDFYDAILLNGDFQEEYVRKIESLRNLPNKELFVVGSAYHDVMKKRAESRERNRHSDCINVLLAPSWGASSILSKYGIDFLKSLKNTGYNIIVRPHPQSLSSEKDLINKLEKEFPETDYWHWNYDNDNFDVLSKADIMISDFSGVIFDYSLIFGGAVIYTEVNIDKSPYDAWWLDEPMVFEALLPQIGRKLSENDIDSIKTVIEETLSSKEYEEGRRNVREKVWMYQGQAATRTVDYLMDKLDELSL